MTTLEKEIQAFSTLIERELARLIEIVQKATRDIDTRSRVSIAEYAFVLAWRERKSFDPTKTNFPAWFARFALSAANDYREQRTVWRPSEECLLVQALGSLDAKPAPAEPRFEFTPAEGDDVPEPLDFRHEAPQKEGHECPPCWRCRYFDGWLPIVEIRTAVYTSELAELCRDIDQRKVQIAHEVRARYSPELLQLDDEQAELTI
jgi:hypothetical protein